MLREIDKKDLPELIEIENLTQIAPWTMDTFLHCLRAHYLGWVVERENVTVGFIFVTQEAGECHILNVCVHPDFQNQGIGRQLIDYALLDAGKKGAHFAFLEVRRSNLKAISLYKAMGFNQISERKNYYPHPNGREDALVFAKALGIE